MKITVINGSPKGRQSITLQHIHYFNKHHCDHEVEIVNVASRIKKIEKDALLFNDIIDKMAASDAVIWSFPVYYALVPSQMKRFIELIFDRCGTGRFKGKYTTAFTTSINFFDHTAHNYMQGVCEELGFSYVRSYSAHMDDFFQEDLRQRMMHYYEWFIQMVENQVPVARKYNVQARQSIEYEPEDMGDLNRTSEDKIILLTDAVIEDKNLNNMIAVFKKTCPMTVEVKNIHDIEMKNGCLGCCTCGHDNICIQKDGYVRFFNDHLRNAQTIIIAGSIKDHYLSSTWKTFFDRSFFNGHAPVLKDKHLGFIISGPLSQIQNLRELLELFAQTWHMKTCGIVTDEHATSEEITRHIRAFSKEFELASEKNLNFGARFYRVGGFKIFRDFVHNTSAVFKADHIFYKKTGVYNDFPQKKIKKRVSNYIFSLLMALPFLREKIHKDFIPGMVRPYKKVLHKS